ncbi:MAG: ATP-binding protein [Prevotella sp.]|jgi:predicted kinase|nr:ATP-binding protein [Prevotella sp.]
MIWQLTQNKDWAVLENQFSWVADMKHVKQHKVHHAEGNVAIHTQMVINELQNNSIYQSSEEQVKEILWTAALLHDVEKRSTSVDMGDGIINADGHARREEYTARTILFRDIPTPFYIREQIASLVRFHGLPLWLMEKHSPAKKVHEISLRLNTQHLKLLAEADARGRICEDLGFLLDSLDLFELFCKEQDCWGKAKHFATPNARFRYFNTPDSYVDYIPFDDFKCEVTLMSGLPGMGKDHYIQSLDKDIPVISLDAIRRKNKISPTDRSGNGWVVQTAKEEARSYLRRGQDFVWNATNVTQQIRSQLVDLFVSYGARVKIVYVEKPYELWRGQNRNREYPLPENVLDKLLCKLEIPQLTEAHEVEYIF